MNDSNAGRRTVGGVDVDSEAAFRRELQRIVRSAAMNDVDVTGGWSVESRSENRSWDVVVTMVRQ